MTQLQIQYFLHVAETQNVTKSARVLNISQPALSKTLRDMEEELGVPLFDRVGRGLVLNAYGEAVQTGFQKILQAHMELDSVLEDMKNGETGTVRIGTSMPVRQGTNWLISAVDAYADSHPRVRFDVFQMRQNSLEEAVLANEIDFAVSSLDITSREIEWRYLFSEALMVALSRENPLAKKENRAMKDFREETFLCNDNNSDIIEITKAVCRKAGFNPNITMYGGFPSIIRNAVTRNDGVTIVLKEGVEDLMEGRPIMPECSSPVCNITEPPLYRHIGIARLKNRYQPTATSAFLEYLHTAAARLPERFIIKRDCAEEA